MNIQRKKKWLKMHAKAFLTLNKLKVFQRIPKKKEKINKYLLKYVFFAHNDMICSSLYVRKTHLQIDMFLT